MLSMDAVKQFSDTISKEPLGLAYYRPESWAIPTGCFYNVWEKVKRDGGATVYGWAFFVRKGEHGEYLIAQHHAVWHEPATLNLIDVTPFHDKPLHHPVTDKGDVLFLVQRAAKPVEFMNKIGPLPSKFFPASTHPPLVEYTSKLAEIELAECKKIYETAEWVELE